MVTNTSGKKKTAIARATVRGGEGRVRIDGQPVELVEPELAQLKMLEPFRIADDDLRGPPSPAGWSTTPTTPSSGTRSGSSTARCWSTTCASPSRRSGVAPGRGRATRSPTGDPAMMVPVRCFTCGNVVGEHWEEYKARVADGEDPAAVLDDLGVDRHCCRRMLVSHKDLVDIVAPYQ